MAKLSLPDVKGIHVVVGTVERGSDVSLILDIPYRRGCASYRSGKSRRSVLLVPAEFEDYEKYKSACRRKITKIKERRKSGRLKTSYIFTNGEKVGISVRKAVIDNFLQEKKFSGFISMVSSKAGPTPHVHNQVSEQEIRAFFARGKKEMFSDIRKMKNLLYSHDAEWRDFLLQGGISIALIMPTYNETNFERNIQLADSVRRAGLLSEIIVADGYSLRHEPSDVVRALSKKGKNVECTIIRQNGAGKGEAIEAAAKYALSQGHDFCIILDSDNMPALSRVFPDTPADIDIRFFARSFIKSITDRIHEVGIETATRTFFKASYMRMPQLKKKFELRFGLVTRIVKDFYERALGSTHNLYALSGEVAFSPIFLLEHLSLDERILEYAGMPTSQYCGSNVPGGFCLETVWNSIIDIMDYDVCYVNTYLHHHGPVVKSTKTDIGGQIGEVLTGTFLGMLAALIYRGYAGHAEEQMLRHLPREVWRPDRLALNITGKKITSKDLQ